MEETKMMGKLLVSQVLGIAAAYVVNSVLQSTGVNPPLYVPVGAWLFVTLFVLAKL